MTVEELPVFINYCVGKNVHLNGFAYPIVKALVRNKINVFIDKDEDIGQELEVQLKRIVKSRIALVIFSGKYTESTDCLRELANINACMEKGKLVAIPIFYKLDVSTIKGLRGQFGDAFRNLTETNVTKKKWKEALVSITEKRASYLTRKCCLIKMLDDFIDHLGRVYKKLKIGQGLHESNGYINLICEHESNV